MILAMHREFAFLELGTVSKKQVNALVKILVDFAISTVAYFFGDCSIAYGINFLAVQKYSQRGMGMNSLGSSCLTFTAAIPAVISGGIVNGLVLCAVGSTSSNNQHADNAIGGRCTRLTHQSVSGCRIDFLTSRE